MNDSNNQRVRDLSIIELSQKQELLAKNKKFERLMEHSSNKIRLLSINNTLLEAENKVKTELIDELERMNQMQGDKIEELLKTVEQYCNQTDNK